MSVANQTSVNEDFVIILRTIVTFLDNHHFKNTLTALNSECVQLGLTNYSVDKLKYSQKLATLNESNELPGKIANNYKTRECVIRERKEKDNNKDCVSATDEELFASIQSDDLTPRPTDIQILPIENVSYRCMKPSTLELKTELMKSIDYELNNQTNYIKESHLKKIKRQSFTEESAAATLESSFEEDSLSPPENLKERFLLLQDEHRKLMEITAKLTVAFQRNIQGQTENMNSILNNCKDIFPELFCPKSASKNKKCFAISKEEFSQYITHEVFDVKRKNSTASSNFSTDTFEENPLPEVKKIEDLPSNFQLDFQKIKTDLRNGDTNTKLSLLQALRWRITRNPSSIRNDVMATYERFDLLDIRNCSHRNGQTYPKNSKLLESYYCPKKTPDIIQESIARLINTFASMKIGRDYLTRQSLLMNFLLSVLLGTHGLKPKLDSKTRDMTIATMQKMSLRYWQRVTMINAGLCKYMVKFLSDNYKKLSSYCLEYSTALLMNLWLHVDAREKSYPLVKDIIKLLATLLDIKYENCLPYINGSLYSLLPDPVFHKIAKDVKLGQIIEYRIPSADSDMQEQLRCILKIYHDPTNWQPMCDCDLGVEIENEIDLFEPELDADDKFYTSGVSGEQLLYNYRLLFPVNGSQVCSNNTVIRPITPNFGKQRTSLAVNSLSPYARDENTFEIAPGSTNSPYRQIKDFLINRLSDNCIYREIDRIRNETETNHGGENEMQTNNNKKPKDDISEHSKPIENRNFVVLESDVENNNNTNEKIEYLTKRNVAQLKKEKSDVVSSSPTRKKSEKKENVPNNKTNNITKSVKESKNHIKTKNNNDNSKQMKKSNKNNEKTKNETKNDGNMRIVVKKENNTLENDLKKPDESDENERIRIIFKNADESTTSNSETENKNEKIEILIKEIDEEKSIDTENEENTVKLIIIPSCADVTNETSEVIKKTKVIKQEPKKKITKHKSIDLGETLKNENKLINQKQANTKDKNNNKRKTTEKNFISDTKKYHNKSAKERLGSRTSNGFHSPKTKYESKNKSLPTTPFYQNEPFVYACAATTTEVMLSDTLYYGRMNTPEYWHEDYKPVCFCNVQATTSGVDEKNKKSKYSCRCYEKMKHSFEKEHYTDNSITSDGNMSSDYPYASRHCKYAGHCNNLNCSHHNDTDSGFGSRPLDEDDYDAVFESRPKLLRTP